MSTLLLSFFTKIRFPTCAIGVYPLLLPTFIVDVNEFLVIGGQELLSNSDAIILIEWPERIKPLWEKDWIYIYFEHDDKNSNKRKIITKDRAK